MRPTFAKHPDPIEIPDLLSLQTESFDWLVGAPAWRAIADWSPSTEEREALIGYTRV